MLSLLETTIPTPRGDARVIRREGKTPTLVLIHGCGGNEHTFDFVLPGLDDIDVVVPALPGRAGSTGLPFESAAEAGRWVLDLARTMKLGAFVVAGHSYGGAVAIECALASAETNDKTAHVAGLALVSSGARLRVSPAILELAEEAVARREPLLFGFAAYQPSTDPARIEAAERIAAKTPPEATAADWRACDGFDRMKELARIAVPTLAICGTEDMLTPPKYASFVATNVPGARMATIEGGGHVLPVDKPEELASALAAFVTDVAAR